MNPSGDQPRQVQSLIQEFLDQHPEPTPEHEESLCSQHPDLAPLLRELLPRVRGLTAVETRKQIERLITHDTLLADGTLVSGPESDEGQPTLEKPLGADTAVDATMPVVSDKPLFDGRYRIVKTIGKGGFGRVDLVEDTLRRNERVALKVILPKHADTKEFELRFQNEISVLRALQHEGIPQIFNDGLTSEGEFYFTMEFVKGTALEDVLEREKRLGPRRIVRLVRQITNTLEYAHSRGVVHRDLKPNNVILVNEGKDDEQAKVLDFGIAKILKKEGMLEYAETMDTLAGMGTPHYMSPEQVRGKEIDGSTDFYALGIIIYRMVSSRFPFKGKTPMEIATTRIEHDAPPLEVDQKSASELTTQLASLVKALLEREKDKRPDAEGIRKHLVLEGMAQEQRRFHRFGRRVIAVAAAAVVVVVAYFAWTATTGEVAARDDGDATADGGGSTTDGGGDSAPIELPPGTEPSAVVNRIDGPVQRPFTLSGLAGNVDRVRVEWADGDLLLDVDASEVFSAELDLPDGRHDLSVVEPDSGDVLASTTVLVDGTYPELEFDTIPGIEVEQDGETRYYVREPSVEIRGSVTDEGPSGLSGLKVNSNPVEPEADGSFSYTLFEDVGATDQSGAAKFAARDGAMNETVRRLHFVYDGSPPKIRFAREGEDLAAPTLEITGDQVQLTVGVEDSHPLALYMNGQALPNLQETVDLELGEEHERTYEFRATDFSGRESTTELTISRKLALASLSMDEDASVFSEGSYRTPRESVAVTGHLNRPAEKVEVALGSGERVAAALTEAGLGFEIELPLVEKEDRELKLFGNGIELGSWTVTWEPPRAPGGLVRVGTASVDGRAKVVKHEKTGMLFVLVTPPDKPYPYGDVQVDVDRPYYIGQTEVTRGQFEASEYEFNELRFWKDRDDPSSHAMVGVSFDVASQYCDWLDVDGARLPTEAEWLHAAGGPTTPTYPWGDSWDASLCHSRGAERHPVSVFAHANPDPRTGAWGFAGNASEWCTKPDGTLVVRGGSWNSGAEECMLTASRTPNSGGGKSTVGFRVVVLPE